MRYRSEVRIVAKELTRVVFARRPYPFVVAFAEDIVQHLLFFLAVIDFFDAGPERKKTQKNYFILLFLTFHRFHSTRFARFEILFTLWNLS